MMGKIVFCDFDGTITAQETFVAVLKEFAPELATELIPQMYALKVTLREGVRKILESIPSSRLPALNQSVMDFQNCWIFSIPRMCHLWLFLVGCGKWWKW
jgi:2-hydroxy-3-keto-5-methylthiopentenyl-1-phosphate phosphatase